MNLARAQTAEVVGPMVTGGVVATVIAEAGATVTGDKEDNRLPLTPTLPAQYETYS